MPKLNHITDQRANKIKDHPMAAAETAAVVPEQEPTPTACTVIVLQLVQNTHMLKLHTYELTATK